MTLLDLKCRSLDYQCLFLLDFIVVTLPSSFTASSTSDLSFVAGAQNKEVSGLPDPADPKTAPLLVSY